MRNATSGFTMVELIITVVIGSILAAIAVPAFNDFVKNERLTTEANEMIAALMFARTEAIKRNRRITVCKSSNATSAAATCNTTAAPDWDAGWIIFVDSNPPDGKRQAAETLLQAHGPMQGNVTLSPNTGGGSATIQFNVSYIPRGITLVPGGGAQSGTFRLCDDRGPAKARAIVLSQTGRVRVTDAQFAACP